MKVIINKETFDISQSKLIGSGGESTIYKLDEHRALKNLDQQQRQDPNKMNKVRALCDKADKLSSIKGFENIAIPLFPAYEKLGSHFCGFSMHLFENARTIFTFRYNTKAEKFNSSFDESRTIPLIKQLFKTLDILHWQRITLGDINPENILIHPKTFESFWVDIDAAAIGTFQAKMTNPEYCCPEVKIRGKNISGGAVYTHKSDLFSLSVVVFEFLTGTNPFDLPLNPPLRTVNAIEKNINYLNFFHFNQNKFNGHTIIESDSVIRLKNRIMNIKRLFPELYDFLIDTFCNGNRSYFGKTVIEKPMTQNKPKNKKIIAIRSSGNENKTPEEFYLFLQKYQLNHF